MVVISMVSLKSLISLLLAITEYSSIYSSTSIFSYAVFAHRFWVLAQVFEGGESRRGRRCQVGGNAKKNDRSVGSEVSMIDLEERTLPETSQLIARHAYAASPNATTLNCLKSFR